MAGTFTHLTYHLVFGTRGREPLIRPEVREGLDAYIGGVVRNLGGVLLEAGGMSDHSHLVVRLKAETSVAECVRVVKANASRWVRETFPGLENFAWQSGYGAFTVSASQLEVLRAYVRNQSEHHRTVSFADEYRAFLKRHEIVFEERFLLDEGP